MIIEKLSYSDRDKRLSRVHIIVLYSLVATLICGMFAMHYSHNAQWDLINARLSALESRRILVTTSADGSDGQPRLVPFVRMLAKSSNEQDENTVEQLSHSNRLFNSTVSRVLEMP